MAVAGRMCKTLRFLLVGQLLLVQTLALSTTQHKQWLPTSCHGIWDRDGGFIPSDRPFLKGTVGSLKWREVEPSDGNIDWSLLNATFNKVVEWDLCWYGMIHAGPDSPDWIYSSVPKVQVENDPKHEFAYPFYLDSNYQMYWYRMLRQVASFIRRLPEAVTAKISFFQVTTGCTGDEVAYKSKPLRSIYEIGDIQWDAFRLDAFAKFNTFFQTGDGHPIPLLFNEVDVDTHPTMQPWLMENIMFGLGVKGSALVRGHHLSDERTWIETWQKYMVNPAANETHIFTRAEMDQTYSNPLYQMNLQLAFYWGILNGLNQGLAVHDVSKIPIERCYDWDIVDSFEFFNKYAGQIYPQSADSAFIALHEGLDGADITKFPESTYGQTIRNDGRIQETAERLVNICKAYKEFGCAMDDLAAAQLGQVYQRESQKGLNDAGWFIWRGNYQRFLEQIDPDNTSQGWFRIGGRINSKSSKYSRFGRGFNHGAGKAEMLFKFVDGFFSQTPVGSLIFQVIWFDNLRGSWQLKYTTTDGSVKVGIHQKTIGDGQWKNVTFTVRDAAMARTHTSGSDFAITSEDRTDLIFHMIEVTRAVDGGTFGTAITSTKQSETSTSKMTTSNVRIARAFSWFVLAHICAAFLHV